MMGTRRLVFFRFQERKTLVLSFSPCLKVITCQGGGLGLLLGIRTLFMPYLESKVIRIMECFSLSKLQQQWPLMVLRIALLISEKCTVVVGIHFVKV